MSTETISSYSFQKIVKSPLDFVVKEDHTTEKGETDSFCKEMLLSDEEEKETETSSREKVFRQENDGHKMEKDNITVQVDEGRKLRITHSVTLDNFGTSPPKIVLQRLDGFTAGETDCIVIEVTTSNVKSMSSDMTLEVSEIVQPDDFDIKTTLILQNEKEIKTERQKPQTLNRECFIDPYLWNQRAKQYKHNAKSCEYVRFKVMTELKANSVSLGNPSVSNKEMDCCKSWCKDHFCGHHTGGHTDTDFTLVDGSSTCSSPYGFWMPQRRLSQANSHSNETLPDIPLPSRFADKENDVLQDLTENIASCHINDNNVFKEQQDPQYDHGTLGSEGQFSIPSHNNCTQLYDPDVKKNFLRSSLSSVSHNHKWNIQMHNNRANSQSSSYTDIQKKRRRTYPGVAYHSGHDGESKTSCRESFSSGRLSSFFMQSLLCQAETAARYHQQDEREGISERKNHNSFCKTSSQPSASSFCDALTIIPNIKEYGSTKAPFYPSVSDKPSEDIFPKCRHEQEEPAETADQIREDRADQESSSAEPLEQSEVNESGFDEEIMEVESPILLNDNTHQENLLVYVTPREKSITDGFNKGAKSETHESHEPVSTQKKQNSIVTVMGGYEQRSLPNKSISEDTVQNQQSATESTSTSAEQHHEGRIQHVNEEEPTQLYHRPARRTSSQLAKTCYQTEKHLKKAGTDFHTQK